jgi:hypothetical protein
MLTPWGETLPSNEVSVTLTPGNQTMVINWGPPSYGTNFSYVSPKLTVRIYLGWLGSGQQDSYLEFNNVSSPIVLSGGQGQFLTPVPGVPPQRSSAYLPDTDGRLINASTMFRWLNEALNLLAVKAGGILDTTGVATVGGQAHYNLHQKWIKVSKIWFDGWEMLKGQRTDIFYRNAITAISALSVTMRQAEYSEIEIFPQPNRTSGSSVTTAPIALFDTTFTVNSTGGWVLPFGLARITPPSTGGVMWPNGSQEEVVAYSGFSGNTFYGVRRGLGGTYVGGSWIYYGSNDPRINVGWPAGSTVEELNVRISGYRMANTYAPGMSNITLTIPDGWAECLPIYMDAKALDFQGAKSDAAQKRKEFLAYADDMARQNKPPLQGPVQVGSRGGMNNEIYTPGLGGGWIIQ